jgi:hypothetical protein
VTFARTAPLSFPVNGIGAENSAWLSTRNATAAQPAVGIVRTTMKTRCAICPTCSRRQKLTRHHIVPTSFVKNHYRSMLRKNRFYFYLCRGCHDELHVFLGSTGAIKPAQFFKLLWQFVERRGP